MSTPWTPASRPSATPYTVRTPIQRFGSYLCDRLGNQICDRLGNPFVVYDVNGDIDLGGTPWTGRVIP